MNPLKRAIASTATVAVGASALTVLAGVGVANAASGALGNLSVSPVSGVANNASTGRPTFASAVACPSGASAYDALMNGPSGSGWSNIQALGNTAYAGGNISAQLSDTFANIAAANATATSGKLPAGTYTVTFRCLDQFGAVVASAGTPATGDAVLVFAAPSTATAVDNAWHVSGAATSTTLAVSGASIFPGDSETLTATVAPTGVAGTITFKDGATTLGTATVDGVGTGAGHSQGAFTTSTLGVGSHSITAAFAPTDTTWGSSTSAAQTVTVSTATSTSAFAFSPASGANTSTAVTFNCTVSGPAAGQPGANAGVPAGTVVFSYAPAGSATFTNTSPIALSNGSASFGPNTYAGGNLQGYCTFTPAAGGNYSGSTAPTQTMAISSYNPNTNATEFIQTTVNPGALTLTVIGFTAPSPTTQTGTPIADNTTGSHAFPGQSATPTNVVILPAANVNSAGTYIVTDGDMIPVQAVDTRAGDPGYQVTGQLLNLVGTGSSAHVINAANFGWAPAFISSSRYATAAAAGPALTIGTQVPAANGIAPAATPSTATGGAGLSAAQLLYRLAANGGSGTTVFGAHLSMQAPTSTPADTYVGTLTLTAS